MKYQYTKRLLVEGDEDKRVIPELIEANGVRWAEVRDRPIVWIEPYDGIDSILAPGAIEIELKASGLEALGVVIDANDDPEGRWRRLRARCLPHFTDFPETPMPDGLLVKSENGVRFGVWLMPDNTTRGMLETFLANLRDPAGRALGARLLSNHRSC